MKVWKMLIFVGTAVFAVCALIVIFPGCEEEPDTDIPEIGDLTSTDHTVSTDAALSIDPPEADITAIGQAVDFYVTGSEPPFYWDVSDETKGTIQVQGDTRNAIYTAAVLANNTVVVKDYMGLTASAQIYGSPPSMSIVPTDQTLTSANTNGLPNDLDGLTINFTAVGGSPPYTWTVTFPALGTVNNSGVYTVDGTWGTGNNTIVLTDSASVQVTATVTTELSTP